jgi:hypothetical protein
MPHGDSLYASPFFNGFNTASIDSFGNQSTNGLVVVPRPAHPSQHYVFSLVSACFNPGCLDGFCYQLVDMAAEGGLGDVVERNVFVEVAVRNYTEKLAACRHGNGRDWWLVMHGVDNNTFIRWLVTPDSVQGPFEQNIGSLHTLGWDQGEMCFNKNGTRLGLVHFFGLVEVFDFDRCSGLLSNPLTLDTLLPNPDPERMFYGCEFAPNAPIFYAGNGVGVYQYDLTDEANVVKSLVAANPLPWSNNNLDTSFFCGQMQLGPDDQIYFKFGPGWGSQYGFINDESTSLWVIDDPNQTGTACNVVPYTLSHYPRLGWYGLPNNPNYNLGRLIESPCDTLFNALVDATPAKASLTILTNPFESVCRFTYTGKATTAFVYNQLGQPILSQPVKQGTQSIDLVTLPAGLYILQVGDRRAKLLKQ